MATELDLDALRRRCNLAFARTGHATHVLRLAALSGGASGLTFRAELDGGVAGKRDAVVKVAPPGLEPVRNRDVLRQARLMRSLALLGDVPVPTVLFLDEGDPPEVPPMYAATFVTGESLEPINDGPGVSPEQLEQRVRSAARILGGLHRLNWRQPVFVGEPVVGIVEEIERWSRALAKAADERDRALAGLARAALLDSAPAAIEPTVVHGDYRMGNLLCAAGQVLAVIDWEIWAISDPRIDLAWFVARLRAERQPLARGDVEGMPDAATVISDYVSVVGHAVDALDWFLALASFKQAATTALIVRNNRRQARPDVHKEAMAGHVREHLTWALTTLQ